MRSSYEFNCFIITFKHYVCFVKQDINYRNLAYVGLHRKR